MKTFIVWNPSKVSQYGGDLGGLDSETYEGLKAAEANSNSGISSEVVTDNIQQVIEACFNETDITLKAIEKPQQLTVTLDAGDWAEVRHALDSIDGEQVSRIIKAIGNCLPNPK